MPFPMVHFAVSVQLFERLAISPDADFLLGSIAPDSIHMRTGASSEDKNKTHLNLLPMNRIPKGLDVLEHCKRFYMSYNPSNRANRSFLAGYIAHVLTDLYWLTSLHLQFRAAIPKGLSVSDKKKLYTIERSQLDYNLFSQVNWSAAACSLVMEAEGMDLRDGLLTQNEIVNWRRQVLYSLEHRQEPGIENRYITDTDLAVFIRQAAEKLVRDFRTMQIELTVP